MLKRVRYVILLAISPVLSWGQALNTPVIAATAKGPNQIHLSWAAVSNPGYGYRVEIQSAGDSRYAVWQELRPVPAASGYVCDSSVVIQGGTCTTSDPSGAHVYNPP